MPSLTRILLIDDDAVDRQAVRRTLSASDLIWDLTEAATGAEGWALAREIAFDCVLLDFRLPDIDAFALLGKLLTPEGGRQAVLILTGEADGDTALQLMRAGALDHLAKGELGPSGLARAIRYAKARRVFVEELDEARHEAEQKSAALDALNRQKSLLLSIIAHDLRNPFQVLLGMSDFLSKAVAEKDPAKIEIRAAGLKQAASQAHDLMESLLHWAALQMDAADVALAPIALAPVIDAAVRSCGNAALFKQLDVRVTCDAVSARANEPMLNTILRNLVGNAIKFTQPGGSISITARQDPDNPIFLEVCDTGIGMPVERVADLFQVNRRSSTPGTAGESGSGLGLLLCNELAEKMGMQLGVTSREGEGTTFSLSRRDGT